MEYELYGRRVPVTVPKRIYLYEKEAVVNAKYLPPPEEP